MKRRAEPRSDDGSAVVEFTLVSVLVVVLFLLVLQLGLVLHTRNVLIAAAQEGARYAANADRVPADGVLRTTDVIEGSLGRELASRMVVTPLPLSTTAAGAPVVGISVQGPLPFVFAPIGPLTITVEGHALAEGR